MNYFEWNNAIAKHFFNPECAEKEVILYFSETIIEEIGKLYFDEPEGGYIDDFYQSLNLKVFGPDNDDYINRMILIESVFETGLSIKSDHFKYPPYLTYMLAFILPFTSGEISNEFSARNFHNIAKAFFEKNNLSFNYDQKIKYRLKDIDFLWESLNKWLIESRNFSFGFIDIPETPENYKYAGKFLYHVLFRKEQEEKLTQVFDKENILPNGALDNILIKKILINYKDFLRLSADTIRKIKTPSDFVGQKLIQRVNKFYKDWDGSEYLDPDNNGFRGYSRSTLLLCLEFNKLNSQIKFNHFRIFTKKEYPEELKLEAYNGIDLGSVFQVYKEYSSPIKIEILTDLEIDIELRSKAYRWKFNWKSKDFYLFIRDQIGLNEWVQKAKVQHNSGRTLIICKESYFKIIDENNWLDGFGNGYKKYDDTSKTRLKNGWLAITIDDITKIPHPTINELQPDEAEKPRICYDQAFYNAGCFYKDKLPNVWVENSNNLYPVIAKYVDDSEVELNILEDSSNSNDDSVLANYRKVYSFSEFHIAKTDIKFKLVAGDIESHLFYEITDFQRSNNFQIEDLLPKRNAIGEKIINGVRYAKGLEVHFEDSEIIDLKNRQYSRTGDTFYNRNDAQKLNGQTHYNRNQKGNIILHYLSYLGKIHIPEFNSLVYSLIEYADENVKRKANHLKYQLQDLGYIEYDNTSGVLIINKPLLVIKPSTCGTTALLTGARDPKLIETIINFSKNNHITVDIQNQNDDFLPQTVLIKFISNNHIQLEDFAKKLNLSFMKDGLNEQYSLGMYFSSIENWLNFIRPVENEVTDIEGGEIFDMYKLEFVEKTVDFDRQLSLVKFSNINGYKTIYRFWYQGIPYVINDQQYGIYLLFFLFNKKQLEKEEIEKCINILIYDRDKKYLAVPLNCRLPRYLTLSISLLTGNKPEIITLTNDCMHSKMRYLIYKNVPSLFANNIISMKLNQKLIQQTITL